MQTQVIHGAFFIFCPSCKIVLRILHIFVGEFGEFVVVVEFDLTGDIVGVSVITGDFVGDFVGAWDGEVV